MTRSTPVTGAAVALYSWARDRESARKLAAVQSQIEAAGNAHNHEMEMVGKAHNHEMEMVGKVRNHESKMADLRFQDAREARSHEAKMADLRVKDAREARSPEAKKVESACKSLNGPSNGSFAKHD